MSKVRITILVYAIDSRYCHDPPSSHNKAPFVYLYSADDYESPSSEDEDHDDSYFDFIEEEDQKIDKQFELWFTVDGSSILEELTLSGRFSR